MIDPLEHRCIIGDGPLRGNTFHIIVQPHHIVTRERCELCDEDIANNNEILAALYEEALS